MDNDTILTDDYVAGLMAKEASDASIKYSAVGLEAFRSSKPANKAKPNTRFLGRIIKETTSHNAALLAKEAAEAQARLDDLTEAEERKRRKLNPTPKDIRQRQLGAISSILLGRSKKRDESGSGPSTTNDKDKGSLEKGHRRTKESHRSGDEDDDNSRSRRHTGHRREDEGRRRSHRDRDERRHRERSRSPRHHRDHRHRHRSRSPLSESEDNKRYSRSHDKPRASRTDRNRGHDDSSRNEVSKRRRDNRLSPEETPDSDPLEDLIGPAPPPQHVEPIVRSRGRGAARGAAIMDTRFSDGYDPVADVQADLLDDDIGSERKAASSKKEDWDEAVETYRDRLKWKQQGADRLRAAGFTDEQIKKWENTSSRPGAERDGNMEDVRWAKSGEKREWDRGKDKG